jgi:thiol-disulfide isomerase/thioredoxin
MTVTLSTMMPLGTKAPDFCLRDVCKESDVSLHRAVSPVATVIMFICNHCPYVKHIQQKLVEVAAHYQSKQIAFIAINSNDVTAYPEDAPARMKEEALRHHYPFPYLYDETQDTAKAYNAACTPDFFVFDKNLLCVYRGRFDDATPGNQQMVTGKDICHALDNIILGKPVNTEQKPGMGCNIKWKKV